MLKPDCLIRGATLIDGTGNPGVIADLAICGDKIAAIGQLGKLDAIEEIDATGLCLAPGFIDVHTHDDTNVIRQPQMTAKISQGVTTVIVGNCGISAAPVTLCDNPPDPMNLLGDKADFAYPRFAAYRDAVTLASPSVNVAALVGHTSLRAACMPSLDRAATTDEIQHMRSLLEQALNEGALGLSSGLAYHSAYPAPMSEVMALVDVLSPFNAVYTTHLRSEFEAILTAMEEAFETAKHGKVPLVISHHKCAGKANWGRTKETLAFIDKVGVNQRIALDCYPYTASSSTLDLNQVTDDYDIFITWSDAAPEQAGKILAHIAAEWNMSLYDAAKALQPAGAVYHCMDSDDVKRVLSHPKTMIGSDGLPNDPRPHPRLWGTFPRVLSLYVRDEQLFSLEKAIHKMTGLSAGEFRLAGRGELKEGNFADLVLFNPHTVADKATYIDPIRHAEGIESVWVNGVLSYHQGQVTNNRNGRFIGPNFPFI